MSLLALILCVATVPLQMPAQTGGVPSGRTDLRVISADWLYAVTWPERRIAEPERGSQGKRSSANERYQRDRFAPVDARARRARRDRSSAIVEVENVGGRGIKEVKWRFAFLEPETDRVLLSYDFTTRIAIGPGERATLREYVVDDRADSFRAGTSIQGPVLTAKTTASLLEVVFSDGTSVRYP